MYDWADQILCATNRQRIKINQEVRKLRGFSDEPHIGDKIISLRNHWDDASASGTWALTNGSIGTIEYMDKEFIWLPKYLCSKTPIEYMFTNIGLDHGDSFDYVPIDYRGPVTGEPTLTPQEVYKLNKNNNYLNAPYEFAYAYAITCHKAQGSQWPKVLVFEEWFPNSIEEHARWLYTAITRAEEKVLIVKK
jgi:exodeoxyribonuclease-5